MKRRILSTSFIPGADSMPLDTSTAYGRTARIAARHFPASARRPESPACRHQPASATSRTSCRCRPARRLRGRRTGIRPPADARRQSCANRRHHSAAHRHGFEIGTTVAYTIRRRFAAVELQQIRRNRGDRLGDEAGVVVHEQRHERRQTAAAPREFRARARFRQSACSWRVSTTPIASTPSAAAASASSTRVMPQNLTRVRGVSRPASSSALHPAIRIRAG